MLSNKTLFHKTSDKFITNQFLLWGLESFSVKLRNWTHFCDDNFSHPSLSNTTRKNSTANKWFCLQMPV